LEGTAKVTALLLLEATLIFFAGVSSYY